MSTPLRSTVTFSSGAPSSTRADFNAALTVIKALAPAMALRISSRGTRYAGIRLMSVPRDVTATGRPKRRRKPHRRDSVGVHVMRVDRVERRTLRQQPLHERQHREIDQQRRGGHADPRNQRIARMVHEQPVPGLVRRHLGILRPLAETRMAAGEKRHRRDHFGGRQPTGDQMAQPIFHEHAQVRPRAVGEQRREGQKAQRSVRPCHATIPPLRIMLP